MPDSAPRSADLVEATPEWSGSDLLVLTTGAAASGLALPFQRATVTVMTGGAGSGTDRPVGDGEATYDTVVVDGPALGPVLSLAALARARTRLRPGGNLVLLPPETPVDAATPSTEAGTPGLSGLVWVGVATLDGRPCAVLRADESASGADIPGRLDAMARTLEITGRHRVESAEASVEARLDSESALLRHLARLTSELAVETAARTAAEQRYATLDRQHRSLVRQHNRLKASKLGALTLRYWRLRSGVRRRLDSRGTP